MSAITENALRPDIEPLPDYMQSLPVFRGYPVPWFVGWIDGEPEFRCADGAKFGIAIREKRCWVCGYGTGRYLTFAIGPMCAVNRVTSEPPCHLVCAQYSARNCPFLSKPQMTRRENDLPDGHQNPGGFMIRRNQGVTCLWTTRSYEIVSDGAGGVLIQVGDPTSVEWWALGKPATRAQVSESVRTGLPALEELARQQDGAIEELHRMAVKAEALWPKA